MKRYSKSSDIKVGVVGYGGAFNMGKHHLELMKQAGMAPVAVAEVDPKRLEVARTDFPGIQTYAGVEPMLKKSDVNLVVLITPHNTHAPLALKCLRAGRHVVCEKPFAITTRECDAMIAAARRSRVLVSAFHNRHWDGCVLRAVQTIVRDKAIGRVVRIDATMGRYDKPRDWWRSSKSISGGVLFDWGVHLLEYSLQLIDSEVAEVTGLAATGHWADQIKWKKDANEDEGFLVARFKSGQWLTLRISSIDSRPADKWVTVTGTHGAYSFDGQTWELIKVEDGKTNITRGANPAGQSEKFYRNIADHLTKGAPLVITPQWARRPIHILDLACRSAVAGKALKARYP